MGKVTEEDEVHPSLLQNATTKTLMKLLKFGIWVEYQIRQNKSSSVEDVIKKELQLYENNLGIREDFQAKQHYIVKKQVKNWIVI
jgi:hypothetical protein